jgi:peptide chain release factor 3
VFEGVNVAAARWVSSADRTNLDEFMKRMSANLARDHTGELVYLAPSTVALTLTQERWPKIVFRATRELSAAA